MSIYVDSGTRESEQRYLVPVRRARLPLGETENMLKVFSSQHCM